MFQHNFIWWKNQFGHATLFPCNKFNQSVSVLVEIWIECKSILNNCLNSQTKSTLSVAAMGSPLSAPLSASTAPPTSGPTLPAWRRLASTWASPWSTVASTPWAASTARTFWTPSRCTTRRRTSGATTPRTCIAAGRVGAPPLPLLVPPLFFALRQGWRKIRRRWWRKKERRKN